jgi:hypothetical protein
MLPVREWSFPRVALACVVWVVLCVLLTALWLVVTIAGLLGTGSGSGGIGAVSIGLNALVLLIPVGPPIVLVALWLILRGRRPAAR